MLLGFTAIIVWERFDQAQAEVETDVPTEPSDVCCWGKTGRIADAPLLPLVTQSGHGAIGFERARLDRPYGRVAAESAATEFDPDQSGAGARAEYSRL